MFWHNVRKFSVLLVCFSLIACGGSGETGVREVALSASLDQGEQWQDTLELGDFGAVIQSPANGSLTIQGNQVTYTPESAFRGADNASIEGDNVIYRISFTVNPVNQSPVLESTEIEVIASREILGTLIVYDQDNDPIEFSLVDAPEIGDFTLATDGTFTYRVDELILPNAQFTVAISDGVNADVVESVIMLPAYRSNEEKAAYYYFSEHSHLLQSERRLSTLQSDVDTEEAYGAIAAGYVLASMDDEVERILVNNIRSQSNLANSYADIAELYARRGEFDKASEFRNNALTTHAQMVIDNGIENMVNADGRFYLGLLRESRENGDEQAANQIINQINLYIDALGGGEYKNAIGFIAQAARTNAVALVEEYLQTNDQQLYQQAIQNVDIMARAGAEAGYQDLTNRPRHFRLAPLYSVWAAEQYFYIGELEKTKRQLAFTLSYYGNVNYDAANTFPAKPYADATLEQYTAPLRDASVMFSVLYPDVENYPLTLLETNGSAIAYNRALNDIEGMSFFLRILNDGTGNNSVENVIDELLAFHDGNPRTQFSELIEVSPQFPKLASLLWRFGLYDEALYAYDRAFTLMLSVEYIAQNASIPRFLTGNAGCFRAINRLLGIGELERAQQGALQCETLLADATSGAFENVSNVIKIHLAVQQPQRAKSLFQQAEFALEEGAETQFERANRWFELARNAMSARAYTNGHDYFNAGLNALSSAEILTVEDIRNTLTVIEQIIGSQEASVYAPARSLLVELRSHAYNELDYSVWLQDITTSVQGLLNDLAATVVNLPDPEHDGLAEELTESLASARLYRAAETTLQQLSIGEVERLQNLTLVSNIQAIQDDFPASAIATVDTDGDGRANFYAIAATAAQLAETDIQLDDDADGDGVIDEEDPQPLG